MKKRLIAIAMILTLALCSVSLAESRNGLFNALQSASTVAPETEETVAEPEEEPASTDEPKTETKPNPFGDSVVHVEAAGSEATAEPAEEPASLVGPVTVVQVSQPTAAPVGASGHEYPHVIDDAGLLTDSEEAAIEERIQKFIADRKMDFAVLISDRDHVGQSTADVADVYYEQNGFGTGEKKSGILYYVDYSGSRTHYLSTSGDMIDYMTDARIQSALSTTGSLLSAGRNGDAILKMVDTVDGYVHAGIPEGQYQYDELTGERTTEYHKVITGGEAIVCALIALAVGLIIVSRVKTTYELRYDTYSYDLQDYASMDVTESTDEYVRTSTSRVRKVRVQQGGGMGGGGGHIGGSGTHISSGGGTHGGGGAHF